MNNTRKDRNNGRRKKTGKRGGNKEGRNQGNFVPLINEIV